MKQEIEAKVCSGKQVMQLRSMSESHQRDEAANVRRWAGEVSTSTPLQTSSISRSFASSAPWS
eukprot:768741-Hanusia_phi.AAC.16